MIIQIEKARPSCKSTLDYNEDKVITEGACLIGSANIDSTEKEDIYELFERMERTPRLIRSMSFHASVNPSEEDYENMSEDDILDFISGWMENMGYANQPYLIYRHNDIERQHYHIVSIRVDKNGKKINDFYERRKSLAYMESVAQRYGFAMAEKGVTSLRLDESEHLMSAGRFVPPMQKNIEGSEIPVRQQLLDISQAALQYDISSFSQYFAVLESLGVRASMLTDRNDRQELYLRGLDKDGNNVTESFSESALGINLISAVSDQISASKPLHTNKRREKERVKNIVKYAMDISRSENHFRNMLSKKGISVYFSLREDTSEVIGITLIDHVTKTVFKASELGGVINAQMINEAVDTGKWVKERTAANTGRHKQAQDYRRARRAISVVKNLTNLVRTNTPQPKTTWGGKSKETLKREAEEEERRKNGMTI